MQIRWINFSLYFFFSLLNILIQVKPAYEELIKYIATKKITLAYKTFAATDFQAALEHCKTPGKSEKTLLTF